MAATGKDKDANQRGRFWVRITGEEYLPVWVILSMFFVVLILSYTLTIVAKDICNSENSKKRCVKLPQIELQTRTNGGNLKGAGEADSAKSQGETSVEKAK
jgi:hypothetical protein